MAGERRRYFRSASDEPSALDLAASGLPARPKEAPTWKRPFFVLGTRTGRKLERWVPILPADGVPAGLIEQMVAYSGTSVTEIARRLGWTSSSALIPYMRARRPNPGIRMFAAIAEACGARVYLHFPEQQPHPVPRQQVGAKAIQVAREQFEDAEYDFPATRIEDE